MAVGKFDAYALAYAASGIDPEVQSLKLLRKPRRASLKAQSVDLSVDSRLSCEAVLS